MGRWRWARRAGVVALCAGGAAGAGRVMFPPVDVADEALRAEPLATPLADAVQLIPLRAVSRAWGAMNELTLPTPVRAPLYRTWCRAFDCDVTEADRPLDQYRNLQEFFGRALVPGARPVNQEPGVLASPCDATVLSAAPIGPSASLEPIKGVRYSLRELVGASAREPLAASAVSVESAQRAETSGARLYQMVLYLAPGDYHNFHSPAQWRVERVRHIAGQLLSVNPSVVRRLPDVLVANERVALLGDWEHGWFSFTAIGATNVGSIELYFPRAPSLRTNASKAAWREHPQRSVALTKRPAELDRGELVGGFRLGSCIVLAFEAPEHFTFRVQPGDKVKCGQAIGAVA